MQNPTYYGLEGVSHDAISAFLTDLIEDCLEALEGAGCVLLEEDDSVVPLPMGRIASFYYLHYETAAMFGARLSAATTLEQCFGVLCAASEYDEMPVRHNEDCLNAALARDVRTRGGWAVEMRDVDDPHVKVSLLLQCHCLRAPLPISDYVLDAKSALDQSVRILQAMIDVCCERGWLGPVIHCVRLLQMLGQGLWHDASPLECLPRVNASLATKAAKAGCPDLAELVRLASSDPKKALGAMRRGGMQHKDADAAIKVCRRLPVVTLSASAPSAAAPGVVVKMACANANASGSGSSRNAYAPRFPKVKQEGWYVVLGQESSNWIAALKRVSLHGKASLEVTLPLPEDKLARAETRTAGGGAPFDANACEALTVFLFSDTYVGLDQQTHVMKPAE